MNDRDCDNCAHHSDGGCSVWECSFEQKEDDTISRQAAVDAVCGWCHSNCTPCEFFPCGEIKAIQALSPAQPNLQPTCNQLATDTISRQAAIDALRREYNTDDSDYPTEYQLGLSAGRRIIDALPSAQFIEPERKTGTWQRKYSRPGVYADLCWHCSICGGKFSDTYANMWKYCPDCGAKMEET